ncbi:MAG: hypothetical protein B7W98_01975, partial [Parcubacteria group bacterium 20-58-5]
APLYLIDRYEEGKSIYDIDFEWVDGVERQGYGRGLGEAIFDRLKEGQAFAHLLSIGSLVHSSHSDDGRERYESLTCDIGLHDWSDGTRVAGVSGSIAPAAIVDGLNDLDRLKAKHPELFMKPVKEPSAVGFRALVKVKDKWFTQYPKQGECMDNGEPEFAVTEIVEVKDGPRTFTTTIGGFEGFFKYGIKEVEAIAPIGANAYVVGGVGFGGKGHVAGITFYRIAVDNTQRMRRDSEVYNDVGLLLKLVSLSAK